MHVYMALYCVCIHGLVLCMYTWPCTMYVYMALYYVCIHGLVLCMYTWPCTMYVYMALYYVCKPCSRTQGSYNNMFTTTYLVQITFRTIFPVSKCHVMNNLVSRKSKAFCRVTLTHNENNIPISRFGRFSSDTYPVLRA
jgi:hypothetical protein